MKAEDVQAKAEGKWYGIMNHLGIDVGDGKHKPCPVCGGEDRFRFDDKGKGLYFCNCCGAGNGFQLVQKTMGFSFPETLEKVSEIVGYCEKETSIPEKKDNSERLNRLWNESIPLDGSDPASKYLRSRGLFYRPNCLRYCEKCYEPDSKITMPAMIAKIVNRDGQPISLHRTYLTLDGKKAPIDNPKKLMPGKGKLNGCAIRLFQFADLIAITEGIETAISYRQLTDIPTFAAVSSTLLEAFEPPDGVRRIVIAGDNDANFAGQKAAYKLANRLYSQDMIVEVVFPEIVGDFNDVLRGQK